MRILIYFISVLIFFSCSNKEKVDLIIHNAQIYTVNENFDIQTAIAVHEGKIKDIGKDQEILDKYSSDNIQDLQNKSVYPGFYDAHCHFFGYAKNSLRADLRGSKSYADVIERLKNHQNAFPNTKWIEGRGWDQNIWENKDLPNKNALDSMYPDIPVSLIRIDGHAILLNQKALDICGIDENTIVDEGKIVLENGKCSGLLIDIPREIVNKHIPNPSNDLIVQTILKSEKECFEVGLTSLIDPGVDLDKLEIADSLQKANQLKIKLYLMLNPIQECFDYASKTGFYQTDRLSVRAFKLYSDGALGSRGACLLKAYSDDPKNYGILVKSPDQLDSLAKMVNDLNYQLNTHCIGDSANRTMLKIYSKYLEPENNKRWRVEHAQIVNPKDIDIFRNHNIIPSVQPTHCTSDMFWADERLGEDRISHAYTYKSLLDARGLIAFGSDFPVEYINPIYGFHSAVARQNADNLPEGGFQMEEAISRENSLRAMTIWAAFSAFEENEKGSLEIGKWADFVILDRDIMKVKKEKLRATIILNTFINGEEVFRGKL